MSSGSKKPIELDTVFKLLDQWRNLPSYSLEPRTDAFFALYLSEAVEEYRRKKGLPDCPMLPDVIPQFPLCKEYNKQSEKVDYAVFAEDRSVVYLVEIKTDMASLSEEQHDYLVRAKRSGFKEVVEGIWQIALSTRAQPKYVHLLSRLEEFGYVSIPDFNGLCDHAFPKKPHLGDVIKANAKGYTCPDPKIELVYIVPRHENPPPNEPWKCTVNDGLDFEQFAKVVEAHSDLLSLTFAKYIRKWCVDPATQRPS